MITIPAYLLANRESRLVEITTDGDLAATREAGGRAVHVEHTEHVVAVTDDDPRVLALP
ncbi:hypothetical protein IMZ11_41500 [Microtetraspora sp. AC03309]|uniref:hypothetical protein n=1 Tax=Microtetraspora sp. AC03309 TaxID=2779376 RepID=UPI001E400470|nr:hypothetical protein [Microtetraspora sp. AC03309]MCC5582091.1 hypothetical protein [Microtetraspora sp. AC03309]